MSSIAIRVSNLSKRYLLGEAQTPYRTIREVFSGYITAPISLLKGLGSKSSLFNYSKTKPDIIWSLKDISFEIKQGEVIGIIGRNGAGKSTLLKVLSRITKPTVGRAEVFGRVGSLLEVGVGFHSELTGRENIYLNGAIMGMKRAEIKRKYDEIVAFAEIEKFLDTPVKHYSSGMYVRLAFAVAAHLEPEILVVDEVLAVGDTAFQNKCLGKMGAISRSGRTVLFVSHNLGIISQLCREVIWLNEGQMVRKGPTDEIIHSYLAAISANTTGSWKNDEVYEISQHVRLLSASIRTGLEVQAVAVIRFDEPFYLQIYYEILKSLESWALVFRVTDASGITVFTSWDTDFVGSRKLTRVGSYQALCNVPAKLLRPGIYSVSLGVYTPRDKRFDMREHLFQFEISSVGYTMNTDRRGVITPILDWSILQSK